MIKMRTFIVTLLICTGLACPALPAYAASLPSITDYGVDVSSLTSPESKEGEVMAVLTGNRFIMNESVHLICSETEINGEAAALANYTLSAGTKVKVVRYPLKKKRYFVYSLTIL